MKKEKAEVTKETDGQAAEKALLRFSKSVVTIEFYTQAGAFQSGFLAGARHIRDGDLKDAMEALEFYAEERLYVNIGVRADLYADQGKRARAVLARLRGNGNK